MPDRRHGCRTGSIALMLTTFICMLMLSLGLSAARSKSRLNRQLEHVLSGQELERLAAESLDEAEYLLRVGEGPGASREEAAQQLEASLRTDETEELPAVLRPASARGDPNEFLRRGSGTFWFAPRAVASTLTRGQRVRLDPVAATVVTRRPGRTIARQPGPAQPSFVELGIGSRFEELRGVWGILDLSCEARAGRAGRRVVRRKLFALFDYTPVGDRPRSLGYVFPQALGQVIERI